MTNTGIHFHYAMVEEDKLPNFEVRAVTKNGATIERRSGAGSPTDDNTEMVMSYIWRVPLNLDEIDYIKFGNTKIDMN